MNHKFLSLVFLFIFGFPAWTQYVSVEERGVKSPHYFVRQQGNLLTVTTPYGQRTYFADPTFADLRSYSFELPMSDFTNPSDVPSLAPVTARDPQRKPTAPPSDVAQLDLETLIFQANAYYNKGKYQDSMSRVDEVIRRQPDHVRGLIMKGSLMQIMGQKDAAQKYWSMAYQIDPTQKHLESLLEESKSTDSRPKETQP